MEHKTPPPKPHPSPTQTLPKIRVYCIAPFLYDFAPYHNPHLNTFRVPMASPRLHTGDKLGLTKFLVLDTSTILCFVILFRGMKKVAHII